MWWTRLRGTDGYLHWCIVGLEEGLELGRELNQTIYCIVGSIAQRDALLLARHDGCVYCLQGDLGEGVNACPEVIPRSNYRHHRQQGPLMRLGLGSLQGCVRCWITPRRVFTVGCGECCSGVLKPYP